MIRVGMPRDSRIYVAGHTGLIGSALLRRLRRDGFEHVLISTRDELDLRDQAAVAAWFQAHRPEYVFLAAGTVGGIRANTARPVDFMHDNLLIETAVMRAAHLHGAVKLLSFGCACMYPRECPQPMKEEFLMTGPLERTSDAYALAKIAGMRLGEAYRTQYGCNFIAATPAGVYGPHDDFDSEGAHVVPALISRFHGAKLARNRTVVVWGTGHPRREFLHADDVADASLLLMDRYDDAAPVNVGTGAGVSIRELAEIVRDVVYPDATVIFDTSRPDGMPEKRLDVSRLHAIGWRHQIGLKDGVRLTYAWAASHLETRAV